MGPYSVARDRFDYVTAVSESWKRQTLLDLLKVRYADAPVFMDVSSVINSYELASSVDINGHLSKLKRGDEFLGMGATGLFSDKPTITYQPLAGDKFTRSLMTPIPISGVLYLIQSGYPADFVLRICVNSVNDLQNYYGGPGRPKTGDAKFAELIATMRVSQDAGTLGMRMKTVADKQVPVMSLRPSTDPAIATAVRRIRELLGLSETDRDFDIVYGTYPKDSSQVAVLSRSIMQVLIDLSSYIDVPKADVAEERVFAQQRTPEQERMFPPLLTVRSGPSAPGDAFVSVRYRGHWFWIEDTDRRSKQIFNFAMLLSSLTETGASQGAPIVTIPAR